MGVFVLVLTLALLNAQQAADTWARTLAPLLADIRAELKRNVSVGPGTLPPSPFTGRRAVIAAVRVGWRGVDVQPEVVEAMDRLLKWHKSKGALPEEDRPLVERWVEGLRVRVLARLAARQQATDCDDRCVGAHLTQPEALFQGSARQRREERDDVLLDTFSRAVLEPDSR